MTDGSAPPRSRKNADITTSLANERTFLAWIRTGLTLLAGAVAIHTPVFDLSTGVTLAFSLWLLITAALCMGLALYRWRRVELAIRDAEAMPGFGGPAAVAVVIVLLIASVAVGVVIVAVH